MYILYIYIYILSAVGKVVKIHVNVNLLLKKFRI